MVVSETKPRRSERVEAALQVLDSFTANSTPATRSSFTATRCIGPTRTSRRIRAGRYSAAITPGIQSFKTSHHPTYEPLVKVSDSKLKETGVKLFSEGKRILETRHGHDGRDARDFTAQLMTAGLKQRPAE